MIAKFYCDVHRSCESLDRWWWFCVILWFILSSSGFQSQSTRSMKGRIPMSPIFCSLQPRHRRSTLFRLAIGYFIFLFIHCSILGFKTYMLRTVSIAVSAIPVCNVSWDLRFLHDPRVTYSNFHSLFKTCMLHIVSFMVCIRPWSRGVRLWPWHWPLGLRPSTTALETV